MLDKLLRLPAFALSWRVIFTEEVIAVVLVVLFFVMPASAMRFQERSLYMESVEPGATTSYTVSLRYMSGLPVGSVDMLFCVDPIPYHPCVPPPGLDVINATLATQTEETGFSIASQSNNHIVLTRTPTATTSSEPSSYKFDNIVNPSNTDLSFSIRLRSHASTDASGPQIDFGSVKGQVTNGVVIQTQVPPMLIFCVAEQVSENCTTNNNNYYTDMGELSEDDTLVAQSQMAVGTNASSGFVITANGIPPSAGTSVINGLRVPSVSTRGVNQFGINLVANNELAVGNDPEGPWTNAAPTADYGHPNQFKYVPGDVVASSPNVSLMRKFTVSYVVNSKADLRPGVYTTTITYVASGRF